MDRLLSTVQKTVDEKKRKRVLLYDFRGLNPFIDHVVIRSASGVRRTHAIADNIKGRVRENGYEIRVVEGNSKPHWVLVGLNSVVVHIFMNEECDHSQLEKLYTDLPHRDFSL